MRSKWEKMHIFILSWIPECQRLGFQIHEDSVDAIEEISKMPGLKLEGMFTHFAKADETDKAYTDVQIGKYN